MKKLTVSQYLIVILSALAWAGMLNTGWLFSSYYALSQEALGLSDATMGTLVSMIGLIGVVGYIFSGIFTDSLGYKLTTNIGMVITSIGAVILMMNPTESMAIVCCALMCGGGVVFYCTAVLRMISATGGEGGSGRCLGYFYAIMGLFSLIEGTLFSRIIAINSAAAALRVMLIISVVSMIGCNLVVNFIDKSSFLPSKNVAKAEDGFKFSQIGLLFKSPRFLALCIICFCTVSCSTLMTYTQPLLTSQFGLESSTVTLIGTWTNQGTILVLSTMTGYITDKIGSAAKMFVISLSGLIVACGIVLATPWQASFVALVIFAMVLIKTGDAVGKPGRMILAGECGLPESVRGTAIGFMSVVMALPGMIFGQLFGSILTAYNNSRIGYQIIYIIFIGIAVVGLLGVALFSRLKKAAAAKAA